jgi:SWI/SNF-related matrix-associated actin-dependent regulator of chromatin subfamily A member 5
MKENQRSSKSPNAGDENSLVNELAREVEEGIAGEEDLVSEAVGSSIKRRHSFDVIDSNTIDKKSVHSKKRINSNELDRQLLIIRNEQARSQRARLRYLLGESSEFFSHFLQIDNVTQKKVGDTAPISPSKRFNGRENSKRKLGGSKDVFEPKSYTEDNEFSFSTRLSTQPSSVVLPMRDYQLEGLNWMISLHENGLNGILADEMGLGKTCQAISLLAYGYEALKNEGPHIVLVPKSTLANWMNELKRFCPALTAIKLHGDKDERSSLLNSSLIPGLTPKERCWNVLVTTYEIACIEKTKLCKIPWQYLIIDEAHRIKNENSALALVVRDFVSAHRLLITGTPLQNNLHELWALLNFLLPDIFASSDDFDTWFNLAADSKDDEAKANMVKQLHKVLKPFMLRRLKSDVAKALPAKTETLLYVPLSNMQKELYKSVLKREVSTVLAEKGVVTTGRLSNLLMQLRKVCNHPYLFEGMENRELDPMGDHVIANAGKLQLLDKLLHRLHSIKSRVLIFSQFTTMLDILDDYCTIRGFSHCRIDGNTSYEDREQSIDDFNAPNSKHFIFLLSTRAGGLGINLATADVVILYDSDWNPQVDLQAQDRAHRIGQTKPVKVYRLITEGSVEEKIIERAMLKLKLDAVVVQQGRLAEKNKGLSKDEMVEMVQFGADAVFKAGSSSEGETKFTDADIDQILAIGEAKTKQLSDFVSKKVGLKAGEQGLLNFKINSESTQLFEGVDYSEEAARKRLKEEAAARARELRLNLMSTLLEDITPASRTSKNISNYNERAIYATLDADQGQKTSDKKAASKLHMLLPIDHRPPRRMDPWMLFDRNRIMEITAMEIAHIQGASIKEGTDPESVQDVIISDAPQSLIPFDEDLVKERKQLINRGFPEWKRDDFDAYISSCAHHGRRDDASIISEVARLRKKSEEEVAKYHAIFWAFGSKCFPDVQWAAVMKKVTKGESSLLELKDARNLLLIRLSRAPTSSFHLENVENNIVSDPWKSLSFLHQSSSIGSSKSSWTSSEDSYLLSAFAFYGSMNFHAIHSDIFRNDRFQFDYFFRSRTPEELESRVRFLLKNIQKEVGDVFLQEQKAQQTKAEVDAFKLNTFTTARGQLLTISSEIKQVFSEMYAANKSVEESKEKSREKVKSFHGDDYDALLQKRVSSMTALIPESLIQSYKAFEEEQAKLELQATPQVPFKRSQFVKRRNVPMSPIQVQLLALAISAWCSLSEGDIVAQYLQLLPIAVGNPPVAVDTIKATLDAISYKAKSLEDPEPDDSDSKIAKKFKGFRIVKSKFTPLLKMEPEQVDQWLREHPIVFPVKQTESTTSVSSSLVSDLVSAVSQPLQATPSSKSKKRVDTVISLSDTDGSPSAKKQRS